MKICPKCNKKYDATWSICLTDNSKLLDHISANEIPSETLINSESVAQSNAKRKIQELLIALALPFVAIAHTLMDKFNKPEGLPHIYDYFMTITPREINRLLIESSLDIFNVAGIIYLLFGAKNKKYALIPIVPFLVGWLGIAALFPINNIKLTPQELKASASMIKNVASGKDTTDVDAGGSAYVELLKATIAANQAHVTKFLKPYKAIDYDKLYDNFNNPVALNDQIQTIMSIKVAADEYLSFVNNYKANIGFVIDKSTASPQVKKVFYESLETNKTSQIEMAQYAKLASSALDSLIGLLTYAKNHIDVIKLNDQGKVEISDDAVLAEFTGKAETLKKAVTEEQGRFSTMQAKIKERNDQRLKMVEEESRQNK